MQVGVGEVGAFELDVDLSESVFGVGLMLDVDTRARGVRVPSELLLRFDYMGSMEVSGADLIGSKVGVQVGVGELIVSAV